MDKIVYKDESYKIIGACFNVYNTLGSGFLEQVYQECLEIELEKLGIPFVAQKEIGIKYGDIILNLFLITMRKKCSFIFFLKKFI